VSRLTPYAPFFFGLLLAVTGVLGMTWRLPKNDWFGIRMHVVMSSEAAWLAGHRAGGPWLLAGGLRGSRRRRDAACRSPGRAGGHAHHDREPDRGVPDGRRCGAARAGRGAAPALTAPVASGL